MGVCFVLALAASGISAAMGLVALAFGGDGLSNVAGAIIFAGIAVLVKRRWRSAAVAGLLLLVVGLVTVLADGGLPGIMDLLSFVALVNGVRGTFAFARLSRLAVPPAITPS